MSILPSLARIHRPLPTNRRCYEMKILAILAAIFRFLFC